MTQLTEDKDTIEAIKLVLGMKSKAEEKMEDKIKARIFRIKGEFYEDIKDANLFTDIDVKTYTYDELNAQDDFQEHFFRLFKEDQYSTDDTSLYEIEGFIQNLDEVSSAYRVANREINKIKTLLD